MDLDEQCADFEHVRVEHGGHVMRVTIDRPQVMNALHPAAHRELARAFDLFAGTPALWAAVITGSGERAFCTGTDLKHLAATGEHDVPESGFGGLAARFDLEKPVVAAVNGAALGGGLEIVLACDVVIAAEHASFGFPEPRVGLAAMGGGLQRLVRQVPQKLAMGLILTGRPVDAREAARIGLVNEVVPGAALAARTQALLDDMIACAPLALQASKSVALESLRYPDLAHAIRARYRSAERMLASEDAVEGPKAFAAKRPPRWRGR